MFFIVGIIALCVGADAASKLNQPNPTPAAWFEVVITGVLIVIAVALYFFGKEEDW